MPSTALATKALARARRSSGGRPGPRGGSGTKASRPITSRVVTRRPSASVIGSTSSRSQGKRVPWIWLQRAFMASRGSSDMLFAANLVNTRTVLLPIIIAYSDIYSLSRLEKAAYKTYLYTHILSAFNYFCNWLKINRLVYPTGKGRTSLGRWPIFPPGSKAGSYGHHRP